MSKRIWTKHSDLAIKRNPVVRREEYLDFMTFNQNERPLFTEIFGPLLGLKEEWLEQGDSTRSLRRWRQKESIEKFEILIFLLVFLIAAVRQGEGHETKCIPRAP